MTVTYVIYEVGFAPKHHDPALGFSKRSHDAYHNFVLDYDHVVIDREDAKLICHLQFCSDESDYARRAPLLGSVLKMGGWFNTRETWKECRNEWEAGL